MSDWMVICCLGFLTVSDEEQFTEEIMEHCSGVDSVRDDVISCVIACFSVGRLTVSFEAGVKVESEAPIFKTESVAGD